MMKIQVICENCDKKAELTPRTVGHHCSIDFLGNNFRVNEIVLNYDRNVDEIDEVEAIVEELSIECTNCGSDIVLIDFSRHSHYHR